MENITRDLLLANGLTITFTSKSHRYFGDYYRVKLVITSTVPVLVEYFAVPEEYTKAIALLGEEVEYRRVIEQMGVPSTEIERALQRLIDDFIEHSSPYFSAPDFAGKMVAAEFRKALKNSGKAIKTSFHT
jgi:hypothetical protein